MRLEIDTTVSAPPLTEKSKTAGSVDYTDVKSALNQGIKAAQAGNRAQARTSLTQVTELDPRNESAWLWLASISEYPEELLGFLNHVLEINPENKRALEWKAATHGLLSKTFVQRGIDASQESNKDFATECFRTALEYDERNSDAWMWMASLSDSCTVKIALLEKSLAINPASEPARAALEVARADILKERLAEAKAAAVAGDHVTANNVLDGLLAVNPNSVEAWTMKCHLTDSFDEKIRCFEKILELDPNDLAAMAGRDSLLSIFGTVEAAHAENSSNGESDLPNDQQPHELFHNSPTQDPEMPAGIDHEFVSASAETIAYTPEEYDDHAQFETVAEPFASFAEETSKPVEAAVVAEQPYNNRVGESTADVLHDESDSDAQLDATVFGYTAEPYAQESGFPADEGAESVSHAEWTEMRSDAAIKMPSNALPEIVEEEPAPTLVEEPEVIAVKAETFDCPFCNHANDAQTVTCSACRSILTLSDLELLLANQDSDKAVLRQAVEKMERGRMTSELEANELVTLGVGHLNLRNLQMGYSCLLEASKMNPNDVVLGGQVNALLIRLDEIKKQEEAHLKMPKGKSILVVDDSPTVRNLIAGKLEKCGHEVVCANDGVEAMERLEHFVPDLILLDIAMPRMDGYQVCKQIRSNSATKDVTVVMISGKDGFFDKVRGRMAGTTGYITKPFGPETLMKAVEMYLSGEVPNLDEV